MGREDRVKKRTRRGGKRRFAGNQQHTIKKPNTDCLPVHQTTTTTNTTPVAESSEKTVGNPEEEQVLQTTPVKSVSVNKVQDIVTKTIRSSYHWLSYRGC